MPRLMVELEDSHNPLSGADVPSRTRGDSSGGAAVPIGYQRVDLGEAQTMDVPAAWKFVRVLGKGTTGTVIACTRENGENVAVKRSVIGGREHAKRLLREVRLMRKLQYKYLVPLQSMWTKGRDVFQVLHTTKRERGLGKYVN